jgi:hypothetical protein
MRRLASLKWSANRLRSSTTIALKVARLEAELDARRSQVAVLIGRNCVLRLELRELKEEIQRLRERR